MYFDFRLASTLSGQLCPKAGFVPLMQLVEAAIWDLTTKLTSLKKVFLLFQTIDFPQRFYETPALVTTAKHSKDDVNSRIDADNNAITEWIEVTIF